MQSIVVPTDFSENADNALVYACEMAKVLKLRIVLFHAYQVPLPVNEVQVVPFSEEEIKADVVKGLGQTKESFKNKFPEQLFEMEAMQGNLEHLVNNAIAKHHGKYIVMGTKGASGLAEILIGTHAAGVMEKANCPVICVPENAKFNGLKKMVLAADYGQHNFKHAVETIEMAKPFSAEVTLLHVTTGVIEDDFEERELFLFRNKLAEETEYNLLHFKLLSDKDVYHGVNVFLEKEKADLLVVSIHTRTIWQKLFHRSLTQRMAYHSHLPVMALPMEKEE